MATPAQIAANQVNARKSTGPRTTEGKARSRANALKHGMAGAGTVVPERDRKLFEARAEAWANDLGAETEIDAYLAGRAALASVRLDRCARQEAAALAEKRDKALDKWWRDCSRQAQVEYHARRLEGHAAEAIDALQSTSMGCRWLAEQWAGLERGLEDVGGWDDRALFRALNLLGQVARPDIHSAEVLSMLWAAGLALRGKAGQAVGMVELERFFAITEFAKDPGTRIAAAGAGLPDPAEALVTLRAFCVEEQSRLGARGHELWEEVDAPSQIRALDLAGFDDSPAAMLRLRYEAASRSDMHRAIEQVRRSRRARAHDPEVDARNEPIEADDALPEVVEEPSVPAESTPAAAASPPGVIVPAMARPAAAAFPQGPARNEANDSDAWDAELAADLAELDALEAEMQELDAHVDALCTA